MNFLCQDCNQIYCKCQAVSYVKSDKLNYVVNCKNNFSDGSAGNNLSSTDTNCLNTDKSLTDKNVTTDCQLDLNNVHNMSVIDCNRTLPEALISFDKLLHACIIFTLSMVSFLYYINVENDVNKTHIDSPYGFKETKGLRVLSHNVNRLENKFDEVKNTLLFSKNQPNIVGLCETFLTQNTSDNQLIIPGFNFERKERMQLNASITDNPLSIFFSYLIIILLCINELSKQVHTYDYIQANENVYNFNETNGFIMCSHNINRISNKFDEIKHNLLDAKNPPHIIGFCETFLDNSTTDNEIEIQNYSLIRKDRVTHGGGLLIYFSNNVNCRRLEELKSDLETVWLEVKPDHRKSFLVCFVYRPPQSLTEWFDKFEYELLNAMKINTDIILMGDFNLDFLTPNKISPKWISILETLNFHQIIQEPTRITENSKTLIDHIYVRNRDKIEQINVLKYSLSDHYP